MQNQKRRAFRTLHTSCHVGTSMKKIINLLMKKRPSWLKGKTSLLDIDCDKGHS
jgi:hypothetical protein